MPRPIYPIIYSTMVRAGRTTYFIDVKEAKNGNRFLAIQELRLNSRNKKERTTIRVFNDAANELRKAIDEAVTAMS